MNHYILYIGSPLWAAPYETTYENVCLSECACMQTIAPFATIYNLCKNFCWQGLCAFCLKSC